MKIGLNATCLSDRPSGAKQRFVGIYGELIQRLPEVEFIVYDPSDCAVSHLFGNRRNVTSRPTPLPSAGRLARFSRGLAHWPIALRRDRLDIFECFNQPLVLAPSGKTILTIHDVRRLYADWNPLERSLYRATLRRDLERADHVVTVSEAMRAEILDFFPSAQISVVYNGLDTHTFDSITLDDLQSFRAKHALPPVFVTAVGHLERRKNYLRLIDAVALLRGKGFDIGLVIIGNDSGEGKTIKRHTEVAGLASNVVFLSGLSDLEVRCAYKLSSLFVFASSYEGFGIPIIEAMAAGCPMVLSDIPVFREITEHQGVYFPHDDFEAMAAAMERVLSSASYRRDLVEYGRVRVQAFGFKSLAARLESIYLSILQ